MNVTVMRRPPARKHRDWRSRGCGRSGISVLELLIVIAAMAAAMTVVAQQLRLLMRTELQLADHIVWRHTWQLASSQFRWDLHRSTSAEWDSRLEQLLVTLPGEEQPVRYCVDGRALIRSQATGSEQRWDWARAQPVLDHTADSATLRLQIPTATSTGQQSTLRRSASNSATPPAEIQLQTSTRRAVTERSDTPSAGLQEVTP